MNNNTKNQKNKVKKSILIFVLFMLSVCIVGLIIIEDPINTNMTKKTDSYKTIVIDETYYGYFKVVSEYPYEAVFVDYKVYKNDTGYFIKKQITEE